MAGAHLLHDDYVHSRKDSDDEAFNLKIINRLVNTLSRELSLESYWKIRNTVNESMSTQEAEVSLIKAFAIMFINIVYKLDNNSERNRTLLRCVSIIQQETLVSSY